MTIQARLAGEVREHGLNVRPDRLAQIGLGDARLALAIGRLLVEQLARDRVGDVLGVAEHERCDAPQLRRRAALHDPATG